MLGQGRRLPLLPRAAMTNETPIEEVWAFCCEQLPGLADSPGVGIVPVPASPWSYCEGRLTGLIARALGLGIDEVWFTCSLTHDGVPEGNMRALVEVTAGYGRTSVEGRGWSECAWGDTSRFPTKEARLLAVADLLRQKEDQLRAVRLAQLAELAHGITISGTPVRKTGLIKEEMP